MYGDHYGISENHNKAMAKVLGKDITPYENAQLQRVPLFIHAPGVKGIKSNKYGGEVDVAPTLLHLMGVNTKDYLMSGSDLLSPEHREVIPFRNGDFVSPEYTKTNGNYYDTKTGELLNEKDIDPNIDESVKKNSKCRIKSSTEICCAFINRKALKRSTRATTTTPTTIRKHQNLMRRKLRNQIPDNKQTAPAYL